MKTFVARPASPTSSPSLWAASLMRWNISSDASRCGTAILAARIHFLFFLKTTPGLSLGRLRKTSVYCWGCLGLATIAVALVALSSPPCHGCRVSCLALWALSSPPGPGLAALFSFLNVFNCYFFTALVRQFLVAMNATVMQQFKFDTILFPTPIFVYMLFSSSWSL